MQRPIFRLFAAAAALTIFSLAGCGGGDGGTGPGPGNTNDGAMTAKVNGASWSAGTLSAAAAAVPSVPGGIAITGSEVISSSDVRSITLLLYYINGPGTYPLGTFPPVMGGTGQFSTATAPWITDNTGTAGTVTFTTLSATRAIGTFQYTAIAVPGSGATGTKVITEGHFDLPNTGAMAAMTEKDGSSLTATLNGAPYIASTLAVTLRGAQGFGLSTIDGDHTLTLWLNGVTAVGTYDLTIVGDLHTISVTDQSIGSGSNHPNWGLTATDVGSIRVTSLTANRVKGTFSATLGPQPNGGATGDMVVSGSFDVGTP